LPADPVARRLQADYIARNPNPVGEKDKLVAAAGGSPYDTAHARFHPAMKRIAEAVGFYDINLMDAKTGDVVYTVAKETDFASNMYHGAYARSGFARVAQRALDPRNGGAPVVEDYTPYPRRLSHLNSSRRCQSWRGAVHSACSSHRSTSMP
jgi:methyl-accepting chemotaxis protein